MTPLLIVKAGLAPPQVAARRGDFDVWITRLTGLPADAVRVARVDEGDPLPDPRDVGSAIVTGSAAMVSDRLPWSESTARWLARAVERQIPILGICYGHQLLARGLGGEVGRNPLGRQIGTVEVRLTDAAATDPLFCDLPLQLQAHTTHLEAVLGLPPHARLLATSDGDPLHAFAIGTHAWGVQFHPEFDAEVMHGYITARSVELESEGFDLGALRSRVAPTPHATSLIRRFAQLPAESA